MLYANPSGVARIGRGAVVFYEFGLGRAAHGADVTGACFLHGCHSAATWTQAIGSRTVGSRTVGSHSVGSIVAEQRKVTSVDAAKVGHRCGTKSFDGGLTAIAPAVDRGQRAESQ